MREPLPPIHVEPPNQRGDIQNEEDLETEMGTWEPMVHEFPRPMHIEAIKRSSTANSSVFDMANEFNLRLSVSKQAELDRDPTPYWRMVLWLVTFPLGGFLSLVPYLLPFGEPSCGSKSFWANWVSQLVFLPVMCGTVVCVIPHFLTLFTGVHLPRKSFFVPPLCAMLVALVIVMIVGNAIFPIPFASVTIAFPAWITGILSTFYFIPRRARLDKKVRFKLKITMLVLNLWLVMIAVWCAYAVVFRLLQGQQQTAFAMLLPILKWITKAAFDKILVFISPDFGLPVVFCIEYFNAIFVSSLYVNVDDVLTVVLIVAMDFVGNVYMTARVAGFPSVVSLAYVLFCGSNIVEPVSSDTNELTVSNEQLLDSEDENEDEGEDSGPRTRVDSIPPSPSPMVPANPQEAPSPSPSAELQYASLNDGLSHSPSISSQRGGEGRQSPVLFRDVSPKQLRPPLDPQQSADSVKRKHLEPTDSGLSIASTVHSTGRPHLDTSDSMKSASSLKPPPSSPGGAWTSAKFQRSRQRMQKEARQSLTERVRLRAAEMLAVQEYVETFVGSQVMAFIVLAYYGWNKGYFYGLMEEDITDESFKTGLKYIAISSCVELVVFIGMVIVLWWLFQIDMIRLLYCNLRGNWTSFFSAEIALLVFVFGLLLVHNGNDFSFSFLKGCSAG